MALSRQWFDYLAVPSVFWGDARALWPARAAASEWLLLGSPVSAE